MSARSTSIYVPLEKQWATPKPIGTFFHCRHKKNRHLSGAVWQAAAHALRPCLTLSSFLTQSVFQSNPRTAAILVDEDSWAEFAAVYRNTREHFLEHERARGELKSLIPEDAKEAIGHGVRAKRSKAGAVSFDLMDAEAVHAPVE